MHGLRRRHHARTTAADAAAPARPDAAQRHRPRRALRRQRPAGRLLLRPRLRLPRGRLRGPGDRRPRPRLPRPPAGPHPARAHRRAALGLRDRRPPAQARRRREGHRGLGARRRPRLRATRWSTAPSASTEPHEIDRRARHASAWPRSGPTATRCTPSSHRGDYDGPFLPGYAARERGTDSGMLLADRPHRRQRRAHGRVGHLLRERLRDAGDDPLHRRRHRHRVLRADVQGRRRRQGRREVPDQRARRGQAQVADRGVPRVLRGRRAPSTSPSPRATSSARCTRCAAAASSS